MQVKGVIFDLDGVITQTANVHFIAWKRTFEEFLKSKGADPKFTYEDDYVPYVDGKPRYKGVQSFIESRGFKLPFGDPSDKAGKMTYCGIGNNKNIAFREVIKHEGVDLYDSTLTFIKELEKHNIQIGVASSSKNCRFILESVNLAERFETIVDGEVSQKLQLKGKPEADIFEKAASNMRLHPKECVVVEDAISGVQAGRNGNFGLVLGITRTGDKQSLLANGADIVVNDMEEISFENVLQWFKNDVYEDNWHLTYHGYNPEEEMLREALTTTGNGYFGSRGAFESERADDDTHYPGTYVAGVFNKTPSKVHDKTIFNNDFVNLPNWLLVQFKIGEDKKPLTLANCEVLEYEHRLNMRDAIMTRYMVVRDKKGRETEINVERFANIQLPHHGHIKYEITPLNYNEKITIISGIDGSIINYGVPRYRQLNSKHLDVIDKHAENGTVYLHARTNASKVDIHTTIRNQLFEDEKQYQLHTSRVQEKDEEIYEHLKFNAEKGKTYKLEKTAAIYTSRDMDVADPQQSSRMNAENAADFETLFISHRDYWHGMWKKTGIKIEGDRFTQKVARLHTYHLLVTGSPHNQNFDAGIPARGLHGEAYRGHIFWDEVYILPFFVKHYPEIVNAFLKYRYRRLDDARAYAREHGYSGAMFPWQTADDGKEETQEIHYNPVSGDWGPDLSRRQRHVSIAIAYDVLEYMKYTGDDAFFENYGSDLFYAICRFWASIAEYNETDKRYHINGVMGPDEFHEKYPGKPNEEGGINDNAYTNVMVSWLLNRAVELLDEMPETLTQRINPTKDEIKRWKAIASKLYVPMDESGIIEQYAGYFDLKELDWAHYKEKYGNIRRMDRILKSENDSPDNYKVSKQADVLMMFFLLQPQQVKETLQRLGYQCGDPVDLLRKNFDYYIKRTSHGSTLSYVVHSYVLKYLNVDKRVLWKWFSNAMESDIYDTQGGTTREGIHAGVMAGSLDIIIKNFAGLKMNNTIEIAPNLPDHWNRISFNVLYKGEEFNYTITHDEIVIRPTKECKSNFEFIIGGKTHSMENRKELKVKY